MQYDFTSILDRRGKDAIAVDAPEQSECFGAEYFSKAKLRPGFDRIPMWVADMNFPTVPSIPEAIIESARIDGASEMRIFRSIVVPLAIPGIATISLFTSLGYWNDWMNALLYINSDQLIPLQYLLVKIQNNIQVMTQQMQSGGSAIMTQNIPTEGMRFAVVVVATLPIALTYPFFQKYFVKGMTIGGVKG